MNTNEFARALDLNTFTSNPPQREITGCYIGDLLSRVMSRAKQGDAWITVMPNVNVAAVAVLTEVACIILPEDIKPDSELINKCEKENIPLYGSGLSAYELTRKIHTLFAG